MIAANMDTTGTFEMVKALTKHKCIVALSKHYQAQDFVDFLKENPVMPETCARSSALLHAPHDAHCLVLPALLRDEAAPRDAVGKPSTHPCSLLQPLHNIAQTLVAPPSDVLAAGVRALHGDQLRDERQ